MPEAALINGDYQSTFIYELCKETTNPDALLIQTWVSILCLVHLSSLVPQMELLSHDGSQNCH